MSGEAGRAVFPECVLLSEDGAAMDNFLGAFGVFGRDLEAMVVVLVRRGVLGPRPPR